MNRTTAEFYIKAFSHMMTGTPYKKTINTETTDYFLDNILKNYGIQKLEIALKSVREHIDYYKKHGKGKLGSALKK